MCVWKKGGGERMVSLRFALSVRNCTDVESPFHLKLPFRIHTREAARYRRTPLGIVRRTCADVFRIALHIGLSPLFSFVSLVLDVFLDVLNLRKSVLVPVQEIEFLGFRLDSKSMLVRPTHKKCTKIKALCTGILSRSFITIRELSQIIGTLVAVSSGVEFGVTFYTRLEILRSKALKASKGQWDSCIPVCATMREDLTWWLMNIDSAYKAAEPRPFTITIYTDACSDKGWGGVCDERGMQMKCLCT